MDSIDCGPKVLSSFKFMNRSGMCRFSRQASDGDAMMMLAPAVTIPW